jgi:extradiol dioxygenase family protein
MPYLGLLLPRKSVAALHLTARSFDDVGIGWSAGRVAKEAFTMPYWGNNVCAMCGAKDSALLETVGRLLLPFRHFRLSVVIERDEKFVRLRRVGECEGIRRAGRMSQHRPVSR